MKFNLYVCENNIAMKGIIYKATNSLSGMVYIGQTKSGLSVRRTQHLKDAKSDYRVNYFHFHLHQCPESFEWEVLDEFRGTDAEVSHALNVAEEYWILKYDATNPDKGYNSTAGGYASDKMADHVRKRLNCQQGAKAVLQYDLDGNFIRDFPSLRSVAAEFDMPKLKNREIFKSSWRGFMWRIKDGGNYPVKIEPYNPNDGSRKVKVAKYDYNGDLVCIYPSLKEARSCNPYCSEYKMAESLSIREQYSDRVILMNYGNINEDCILKHIVVGIISLKPKCESKPKEPTDVSVFDWDGRFVATYKSARDAMRALNVGVDTILRCCKKPEPYHILRGTITKYVFRRGTYKEGDTIRVIKYKPKEKPAPRLKVSQYSLDGVFIKSYTSITKASVETGDPYGLIRKMCLGWNVKKPMRYQWRYASYQA